MKRHLLFAAIALISACDRNRLKIESPAVQKQTADGTTPSDRGADGNTFNPGGQTAGNPGNTAGSVLIASPVSIPVPPPQLECNPSFLAIQPIYSANTLAEFVIRVNSGSVLSKFANLAGSPNIAWATADPNEGFVHEARFWVTSPGAFAVTATVASAANPNVRRDCPQISSSTMMANGPSSNGTSASSSGVSSGPQATPRTRSIEIVSIDEGVRTASTDGFVFASTDNAACPGFDQALTGYVDGLFQVFNAQHGPYRSLSIGFPVATGHTYDLTRRCDGASSTARFFSFGTQSAETPRTLELFQSYRAAEDGIVTFSMWMGRGTNSHNAITGYVNDSGAVNFVGEADAKVWSSIAPYNADGSDRYMATSVTFPVRRGQHYGLSSSNWVPGSYPHATFAAVPGLGVEGYSAKNFSSDYVADKDGFVLASGWTGACLDSSGAYTFQSLSGYANGTRVAFKADYSPWRAVSITYPVLKGQTYRVNAHCTDSATHAKLWFVPLSDL